MQATVTTSEAGATARASAAARSPRITDADREHGREVARRFTEDREGDELPYGLGYWRGHGRRRRREAEDERARTLPDEPPPGWPGAPEEGDDSDGGES